MSMSFGEMDLRLVCKDFHEKYTKGTFLEIYLYIILILWVLFCLKFKVSMKNETKCFPRVKLDLQS